MMLVTVVYSALLMATGIILIHCNQEPLGIPSCTDAEAKQIVDQFYALQMDKSKCYSSDWIYDLYLKDGPRNRIFVNAGFNKGYNFAEFLDIFAPWTGINADTWFLSIKSKHQSVAQMRGVCAPTTFLTDKNNIPVLDKFPTINLIGIDLNFENIGLVEDVMKLERDKTGSKSSDNVDLKLIHAKISSKDGVKEKMVRCQIGDELCGGNLLRKRTNDNIIGQSEYLTIESLTISTIVKRLQDDGTLNPTSIIDLLEIDTEGHDVLALQGCRNLLRNGLARIVIFEYHGIALWKEYNLDDIQLQFTAMKYSCYFAGSKGRLWPISGTCWHPMYEFKKWSNVACFLTTDPWFSVIQKYVVKPGQKVE